jgi:hypothetical protein
LCVYRIDCSLKMPVHGRKGVSWRREFHLSG